MTKLTTHVLDVYSGKPGKGILVDLFYINNSERKKLTSIKLNDDGRANSPLAEGCLLYTSPSPRDLSTSRMPSSA